MYQTTKKGVKAWVLIVVLMMFTSLFTVMASADSSSGVNVRYSSATIFVPDDYAKIQWAVNNASAGDTIIVRDGIYTENVYVNKHLTIQSEKGSASTIVQAASSNDHVFEVTMDYTKISGFTIKGAIGYWKAGIYLKNVDHCNISHNNASDNYHGIYLHESSNNIITNNNASINDCYGIGLHFSSNNIITNNNAANNKYGICLYGSSNNIITNNNAANNKYGIDLYGSSINTITDNSFENDGIFIDGFELFHFNTHILEGNTVNGRPIYYYKNTNGIKVPEDAGEVILVNCTDMTIENINASFGSVGIELAYTGDSKISNNDISSSNGAGIRLYYSNSNTITNNNASNSYVGIYLYYSSDNNITNNNANLNFWGSGSIYLGHSSNNMVTNNNVSINKGRGIYLHFSSNNILTNNNINSNVGDGMHLEHSNNNKIMDNSVSSNEFGICLFSSSTNTITNNNVSINKGRGIYLHESSNNPIYLNNFIDNKYNVNSYKSTNVWNSTEEITYTYNGTTYENYLGNYWSDYEGNDIDGDGIGDTPHIIDSDKDNYPRMEPWENYVPPQENQPPTSVIDSISPNPSKQGRDMVSFNGHGNDSDGIVVAYNWTSGIDGHLSSSSSFFMPASDLSVGTHTAHFTVQDDDGAWSAEDIEYLTIEPANQPPFSSFIYSPINPTINQTITFNASSSYDPDGNITNYNWSFGDGNSTSANESILTYSYESPSDFVVNLTVTDNEGATNGTSKVAKVFPKVPYFGTGSGTYPSIRGTHNGTIIPTHNVNVSKIYIHPCVGTGGHIEYARIWNSSWVGAEAHGNGYVGDWHNLSFDKNFTLVATGTYNYTIITGSYPQIHHRSELLTAKGWINCTEFRDANGKVYTDWIPAIRLE